jgi:hypothetical protein
MERPISGVLEQITTFYQEVTQDKFNQAKKQPPTGKQDKYLPKAETVDKSKIKTTTSLLKIEQ